MPPRPRPRPRARARARARAGGTPSPCRPTGSCSSTRKGSPSTTSPSTPTSATPSRSTRPTCPGPTPRGATSGSLTRPRRSWGPGRGGAACTWSSTATARRSPSGSTGGRSATARWVRWWACDAAAAAELRWVLQSSTRKLTHRSIYSSLPPTLHNTGRPPPRRVRHHGVRARGPGPGQPPRRARPPLVRRSVRAWRASIFS